MLETNEKYMNQKKLDGILSKGFEYKASQKELNTKVIAKHYQNDTVVSGNRHSIAYGVS